MKKYSKVKRLGAPETKGMLQKPGKLFIKEKYDGQNMRLKADHENKRILYGSRNAVYKNEEDTAKTYRQGVNYIEDQVGLDYETLAALENEFKAELTLFVENMVRHSLEYDRDSMPQVIGIDVYIHREEEEGQYAHPGTVEMVFNDLGIKPARTVDVVEATEFDLEKFEIPESEYRDGKAEGVIFKHEDFISPVKNRKQYAKTVSEEFKEKHRNSTGYTKKDAETGADKLIANYCTNARIKKTVHKMTKDRGHSLEMSLMGNDESAHGLGLPIRVSRDILEEEHAEIVHKNWVIDMKEFRSKVADRCVNVLKQMIHAEAVNAN